jgi:O-antigen ligase
MALVALVLVAGLAYITDRAPRARFRLSAYLVGGTIAVALMLAAAINVPAVRDLYDQRALLVQEYDAAPTGRFERQQLGFFLVQEKPLGLGPFEFGTRYGEDEHNTWLKAFTTYGWLGGFAYAILALWTLAVATPLVFKPRPWQPVIQCTYAVFVGHLIVHSVIDTNHWRHLFLLYGMLWGAIAAEKIRQRRERQLAAAGLAGQQPANGRSRSTSIPRAGEAVPRARVSPVPRARPQSTADSALQAP